MTTPFPQPPFKKPDWKPPRPRPIHVRIGSGLLGAGLFIFIVYVPGGAGLPFAFAAALVSVLGANELYRAVRAQGGEPSDGLGYVACIAFQLAAWTHSGARFLPFLPAVLLLLVLAALLIETVRRGVKPNSRPLTNVGTTLLGGIYVGWLLSFLTVLRGMDSPHLIDVPIHGTTQGQWLVIYVCTSTWLSDVGALFVGRKLERHKMAPDISPSKTWEGSLGGLVASCVGGGVFGVLLHLPAGHAFGLSLLCGAIGQFGDLSESTLKRDLGLRDFGNILPGHGGILDRVDSILFSAPLAYYYLLFFLSRAG